MDHTFDIVIVGAGLVGAGMACALVNQPACRNLRLALVDPGPEPRVFTGSDFDPRVVALSRQTQILLEDWGVWPAMEARRVCPYQSMFVWDGEGSASIRFDSHELGEDNLGHIVENSVALAALLESLKVHPQVQILRGRHVEQVEAGEQQKLILDNGDVLQASLVLATDGGNSRIRQLLAMPSREWDYGQDAIVTTVRTQRPHEFTAWQRFMPTGPLAFLPLRLEEDDHYCSIVWSLDEARVPEVMAMNDDEFADALGQAFEHRLGLIEAAATRYSFPLRQRHAVDYIRPGFALVGDAAHTIHPLAGQGVNMGFADIKALAAEIDRAIRRRLPLNDFSILRRYQRARKAENLSMMALMEGFKRLFGSRVPALHVLRNMGMRQVNELSALKQMLAKRAMGLSNRGAGH